MKIFVMQTRYMHPEKQVSPVPESTDEWVQKSRNSSALAMELRLSCTNPSIQYNHKWLGVDHRNINIKSPGNAY